MNAIERIKKLPEIDEIVKEKMKDPEFARSFDRETRRLEKARRKKYSDR